MEHGSNVPDITTGDPQKKGPGAYQLKVDGEEGGYLSGSDSLTIPDDQKAKLLLIDLIQQNTDRHGRNWYYDVNTEKIWAIDNGLAWPSYGDDSRLTFNNDFAGSLIPSYLIDGMQNLLNNKDQFLQDVRDAITHVGLNTIPDEEMEGIERAFLRLEELISTGVFPDYPSDLFDMF